MFDAQLVEFALDERRGLMLFETQFRMAMDLAPNLNGTFSSLGRQRGTHHLVFRRALRLTPRQRAVLVLRYVNDLTEAETAKVLGCSPGTVKSNGYRRQSTAPRPAIERTTASVPLIQPDPKPRSSFGDSKSRPSFVKARSSKGRP